MSQSAFNQWAASPEGQQANAEVDPVGEAGRQMVAAYHAGWNHAVDRLLRPLLAHVGETGTCKGCGASIVWIRHKSGAVTPYTSESGLNHFIDCPQAAAHRKRAPGQSRRAGGGT